MQAQRAEPNQLTILGAATFPAAVMDTSTRMTGNRVMWCQMRATPREIPENITLTARFQGNASTGDRGLYITQLEVTGPSLVNSDSHNDSPGENGADLEVLMVWGSRIPRQVGRMSIMNHPCIAHVRAEGGLPALQTPMEREL